MQVSIIIVNFNTYNLVIDCIKSIKNNVQNILYEIIVVDNKSPNREIESLNIDGVKLILNKYNGGFGYANNIGSKHAKGKYLFFLNSDTILLNNAILELYNFMEKTPAAGICGGNLYTLDLEPTISYEIFKPSVLNTLDNYLGGFFKKLLYGNNITFLNSNSPKKIYGYVSGADMFVVKNIFDEVGGFDEDFFMYYEEVELSYRINKCGYNTYIVPNSKIIHLEGGSQKSGNSLKNSWMNESKKLYYSKTNTLGFSVIRILDKIYSIYKN